MIDLDKGEFFPGFNPRPRVGGDFPFSYMRLLSSQFQSTPPCGGRPFPSAPTLSMDGFNPRPRVGGDLVSSLIACHAAMFQSTPPCGGRLVSTSEVDKLNRFQSTPPCGGRPDFLENHLPDEYVSIHAPVWGATLSTNPSHSGECFNPRPRVGGDLLFLREIPQLTVSIHAPVWGATSLSLVHKLYWVCFNPRPRVGGD